MRGQCYVCENWGTTLQRVGPDKARHEECAPGTDPWVTWYRANPSQQSAAGDILLAFYERGKRP